MTKRRPAIRSISSRLAGVRPQPLKARHDSRPASRADHDHDLRRHFENLAILEATRPAMLTWLLYLADVLARRAINGWATLGVLAWFCG